MSSKYSDKDFTGHDLSDLKDMSNITIENSCFSWETPDSIVFPADMTGTVFVDCNLDNCFIPPGNQVKGGSARKFQVQNDLEDWVLDPDTLVPIEPVNKKRFLQLGLSIDPRDIPAQQADKHPIDKELDRRAAVRDDAIAAALAEIGEVP